MRKLIFLTGFLSLLLGTAYPQSIIKQTVEVTTYTGEMSTPGAVDGYKTLQNALFDNPIALARNSQGTIYVAEDGGSTIKKIDQYGNVTILAGKHGVRGFVDGNGVDARFSGIRGMVLDNDENLIIADKDNHSIRKITKYGVVTTISGKGEGFKDGALSEALFLKPTGVAVDASGAIYVADNVNHRVRKIDLALGTVSTVLGNGISQNLDGTLSTAQIRNPSSIHIDRDGNLLVSAVHSVHKVDIVAGTSTTIAGGTSSGFVNGDASSARFVALQDIYQDEFGVIWLLDRHALRKIDETNTVSTVIGSSNQGTTNGDASSSRLHFPNGLLPFENGFLIADKANHVLRKVEFETHVSGIISDEVTWTQQFSPYVLDGYLTVREDGALNIEAGVEVFSNNNVLRLNRNAQFRVNGRASDEVVFHVNNTNQYFIEILNSDFEEDCQFDYVRVLGANDLTQNNKFLNIKVSLTVAGNHPGFVGDDLTFSNAHFDNVSMDIKTMYQRIRLQGSYAVNTFFFASHQRAGYKIENSEIYKSNFIQNQFPLNTVHHGLTSFTNSKVINTPVFLPKSFLTIDGTVFYSDEDDLRADLIEPSESMITATGIKMTNSYLNGFNKYNGIEAEILTGGWNSSIKNNTFEKLKTGIELGTFLKMEIVNNDFKGFASTAMFIVNRAPLDVMATNNYFNGLTLVNEVEEQIFHRNDNFQLGLVDFSDFRRSADGQAIVGPPTIRKKRIFENGLWTERVKLIIEEVPEKARKLRFYTTSEKNSVNTTFISEVTLPHSEVEVPMSYTGYAVTSVDENGTESWFSFPYNNSPTFDKEVYDATYFANDDAHIEFLTFDEDEDHVTASVSGGSGGFNSFGGFQWLKTAPYIEDISNDGKESRKALKAKAFPDGVGQVTLDVSAWDGFNQTKSVFRLLYIPRNDNAPVLSSVEDITSLQEDNYYTANYYQFAQFVTMSDEDAPDPFLKITEVLSGSFVHSSGSGEVPIIFQPGDNIQWLPPLDTFGVVEAFKIKAYDGVYDSERELTVRFDIRAVNDPPNADFPETQLFSDVQETLQFTVTGVDPGKHEDQDVTIVADYSSNTSVINVDEIEVVVDNEAHTALVTVSPNQLTAGNSNVRFKLSDGTGISYKFVRLDFYETNNVPIISSLPAVTAYVDMAYEYMPEVNDNDPVQLRLSKAPSFLKAESSWVVSRFSGTGIRGDFDGGPQSAQYGNPSGIVFDSKGNMFVVDERYHKVRKVSPDGVSTTFVGGTYGVKDGKGSEAQFRSPRGLAIDDEDNLYLLDNGLNSDRLIKVSPDGTAETLVGAHGKEGHVDGPFDIARFEDPIDLLFDSNGQLWVLDSFERLVRKIDLTGKKVTTHVSPETPGFDPVTVSRFTVNGRGEMIILDSYSKEFFKVINGEVESFSLADTEITPQCIDFYTDDILFVSDANVGKLFFYHLQDEKLELLGGKYDAPYEEAMPVLNFRTRHITRARVHKGRIYATDIGNSEIRVFYPTLSAFRGVPSSSDEGLVSVEVLATDLRGMSAKQSFELEVRASDKVTASNLDQVISYNEGAVVNLNTIAISGLELDERVEVLLKLKQPHQGELSAGSGNGETYSKSTGEWRLVSTQAKLNAALADIAFTPVDDLDKNSQVTARVKRVDGIVPNSGLIQLNVQPENDLPNVVSLPDEEAYTEIAYTYDLSVIDPDDYLYELKVTSKPDWLTHDIVLNDVSTYAGRFGFKELKNGGLDDAYLVQPYDLQRDSKGDIIFLDQGAVRKIDSDGNVSSLTPTEATYTGYRSVIDENDTLYVILSNTNEIIKVSPDGNVETLYSNFKRGFSNGPSSIALFGSMNDLALDPDGNLLILDSQNGLVRKMDSEGVVSTVLGRRFYSITTGSFEEVGLRDTRTMEFDANGNLLLATQRQIFKADFSTRKITLFAGDGSYQHKDGAAPSAGFQNILSLKADKDGNVLVGELEYLRMISMDGEVATLVGNSTTGYADGVGWRALFSGIQGMVIDPNGDLLIADTNNGLIRKLDFRKDTFTGTPIVDDIGKADLSFTLSDYSGSQDFTASIEVKANDMPVISGLLRSYEGTEDMNLSIPNVTVSGVSTDSLKVTFRVLTPNAGSFSESPTLGASFDEVNGVLSIESTLSGVNQYLSGLVFMPAANFSDKTTVEVTAQQFEGLFSRKEVFELSLASVEDLPVLNDLTEVSGMEELPMVVQLQGVDGDADLVDVKIENLPNWLKLDKEIVINGETIANFDGVDNILQITNGPVSEATVYDITSLARDGSGAYFFTDYNLLRKIENGKVSTVAKYFGSIGYGDSFSAIAFSGGNIYIANDTEIFKVDGDRIVSFAGSDYGSSYNQDGQGSNARFSFISGIVPDGGEGLYIVDKNARKIRHMDKEANVTTYTGGNYGSNNGALNQASFSQPSRIVRTPSGELIIMDGSAGSLRKISNGQVESYLYNPLFSWESPTDFYPDAFGNVIYSQNNRLQIYSQFTDEVRRVYFGYGNSDGPEGEFQTTGISNLIYDGEGRLAFIDKALNDLRRIRYSLKHTLKGTPPVGAAGESSLTVFLNDGNSEEQSIDVPLIILSSDKPSVSGLPQSFEYLEGADEFSVANISLEDSDDTVFEMTFDMQPTSAGVLKVEEIELSDSLTTNGYLIRGTSEEINSVLDGLSFTPFENNDDNATISFDFKRTDGVLRFEGATLLKVIPINDSPVLVSPEDTVVYVGEQFIKILEASDSESSDQLSVQLSGQPQWLSPKSFEAKDELIAGVPGKSAYGKSEESGKLFYAPWSIARDPNGDLIVANNRSHNIVRVDNEGKISSVASAGRGYKDGASGEALFDFVKGMAVASDGTIYAADIANNRIRRIDPDGTVTTIAGSGLKVRKDGVGEEASFDYPRELLLDERVGLLYILERFNLRKLNLASLEVSTVPFDFQGFNVTNPVLHHMAVKRNGNFVITATLQVLELSSNGRLLAVYGSGRLGANDGPIHTATFNTLQSVAVDDNDNIYVNDRGNRLLRKITPNGIVSTIAGNLNKADYFSGFDREIQFGSNSNFLFEDGSLIFADDYNHVIRRIKLNGHVLTGVPGEEDIAKSQVKISVRDPENALVTDEFSLEVQSSDKPTVLGLDTLLLVNEIDDHVAVPRIEILGDSQTQMTIALNTVGSRADFMVGSNLDEPWVFNEAKQVWDKQGTVEELNEELSSLKFWSNHLNDEVFWFSIKQLNGNKAFEGFLQLVVKPANNDPDALDVPSFEVVEGDRFKFAFNSTDPDDDFLSYAVSELPVWLKADSTFVIQEYSSPVYSLNLPDSIKDKLDIKPSDLAYNSKGELFVSDNAHHRIFKLNESGEFEVYAGTGVSGYENGDRLSAMFNSPVSIDFDEDDNLYIADRSNNRIRKITSEGMVSTFIGSGSGSSSEGNGEFATIRSPSEIRFDNQGALLIASFDIIGKATRSGEFTFYVGQAGRFGDLDGPLNESLISSPSALLPLSDGRILFFDQSSWKLKMIEEGEVKTLAGNGLGSKMGSFDEVLFGHINSLVEVAPNVLIAVEPGNHNLLKIDLHNRQVQKLLGLGYPDLIFGEAKDAALSRPITIIKEPSSNDYIISEFHPYGRLKRLGYSRISVSGAPTVDDIGAHEFELTVKDGKGGERKEMITINVIPRNTPPLVSEIAVKNSVYSAGGELSLNLFDYFSDKESADTELTYQVVSNSDNTTLTANTISSTDGVLKLEIQNAGTSKFEIKATDPDGASVSTSFDVTITQAPATISFGQNEFVGDGTAKAVSVTTTPAGLTYAQTYDGSEAEPSAIGEYAVVATINERNYVGEASTTLTIINAAPEAIGLSGNMVFENQSSGAEVGSLSVTDQNPNDTHTYLLPQGLTDNASFSLSGIKVLTTESFNYEEKKAYTITVEVTDSNGASHSQELSIDIADVNDAPVLGDHPAIEIVKDLGELSFTLDGLGTGGEASQSLTISTAKSGVVETASTIVNPGNESVTVTFQTTSGQEGIGTIDIIVKDDGGTANGGQDTFTRTVNISVLPGNITVTDVGICGPGEATLTASGADDYRWYESPREGSPVGSGSSLVLNIDANSTYYVAGVFNGTESGLRVPVRAIVFDVPDAPQITNDNGVLSVPAITDMTYDWFLNGTLVEGATDNSFTPLVNGNYAVKITNVNGCFAESAAVQVLVTSTEAPEPELSVTLFPNPARNYVDIEFGEVLKKGTVIRLLDNTGRELTELVFKRAADKARLDVRRVTEGVHLVLIDDGTQVIRKRLMIKR